MAALADRKRPVDHVAVISSPGIGHIAPLLEFSKRICIDHGLQVSFLVPTTTVPAPAQDQLLRPKAGAALPLNLHVIDLPPVDVATSVPKDATLLVRISLILEKSLESLRTVLVEQVNRPKVLVIDMFCTKAFEICKDLSIPVYTFFTSGAVLLTFSLYVPRLDQEVEGEFVDLPGPIQVPSCMPLHPQDLLDQVKNRKIEEYRWFLLHMSRLPRAAGIFANTWEGLEPGSLAALRVDPFFLNIPVPPVHAVGPLIRQVEKAESLTPSDAESLAWLDQQPLESVLFISFGSGGTLTIEQLTELAWGLELSRQRFLWVVRAPTDVSRSDTYFKSGSSEIDPEKCLPEGFLERTRGFGRVVQSWAPQMAILRHVSTGAFMSHCGWNSTLESISCGVPMIAWPLFAEQRMNAAMLAEEIRVAVRLAATDPRTGLVGREEVARVVRMVMEGDDGTVLRRRVRELMGSAAKALSSSGMSRDTLATVCREWKLAGNECAPEKCCDALNYN